MKTILMDMDSTIVDLLGPWIAWYNSRFDDDLDVGDVNQYALERLVKPEAEDALFDFLKTPRAFIDLPPLKGAVEVVNRWHEAGHDILFVTALADNGAVHDQKREWLHKFFPWFNKSQLYFAGTCRGRIRADVFIDDKPSNLLEFKKYNPEGQAWAIAFPYNQEVESVIDLRARGYAEPEAAWDTFERTLASGAAVSRIARMCLAPMPDGKLCREVDCQTHNKLSVPGESYYPKSVWEMLGTLSSTSRFDTMDAELAYLHTIPDRIERLMGESAEEGGIDPKEGVDLLIKSVREIMAGKERMSNFMANQQLMVHRDVIQSILLQIGTILRRYINDDVLLDKIGKDVKNIQLKVDTKVKRARRTTP